MAQSTRTVLLKLSGEALVGSKKFGIDKKILDYLASEIHQLKQEHNQLKLSLVVGGGNIWRGADYEKVGMDRSVADQAGMLATMINGLAIQDALEKVGISVRTMSALSNPSVSELFIRRRALRHLEKGRIVILVGGTGLYFKAITEGLVNIPNTVSYTHLTLPTIREV